MNLNVVLEKGGEAGLPEFSWNNIPKRGKNYQMTTKCNKWPQN
jgi:hypothetical protein